MRPSHVLAAMGIATDVADEVIRVSFGRETRASDIERFVEEWARIFARARSRAA
jgi:cysteine desulfurase